MIDPNDFIGTKQPKEIEEDRLVVSGTFVCQECNESVNQALLNEDTMILTWTCSLSHQSKASL